MKRGQLFVCICLTVMALQPLDCRVQRQEYTPSDDDVIDSLVSDFHHGKTKLDALSAKTSWLEHSLATINSTTVVVFGAVRKLDRTLSVLVQLQQKQQARLEALENALVRDASDHVTFDVAPRAYSRRKSQANSDVRFKDDYQNDAPLPVEAEGCSKTSDCYSQSDARQFEETIQAKLVSSLQFLRLVGDRINSLNTSVVDLERDSQLKNSYINKLSMDFEVLKDQSYRNRRRAKSCDVRVKALSSRIERLELLERRLDEVENVLYSLIVDNAGYDDTVD